MAGRATASRAVGEASYTDINALKSVRSEDKDDALKTVSKQFESLFVKMMMDGMRDANKVFGEGNYLNSNETEFYQDMLDNQMAVSMSNGRGIGLADVIYRQLDQYGHGRRVEGPDTHVESFEPLQARPVQRKSAPVADEAVQEPLASVPWRDPEQFVAALAPAAQKVGKEMQVDPAALIAQAALETGWGQYVNKDAAGNTSNNLFNIKADSRWSGECVEVNTLEFRSGAPVRERASFRAYASVEDSLRDYADFITNSPRYQRALQQGSDPVAYARELQAAGYATDPQYAEKIERVLNSPQLQAIRGA